MTAQAPQTQQQQLSPAKRMASMLSADSVKAQFQNALKEHSDLFLASILDIYSDAYLQKCDPARVIQECLKAATLRLPLNKQLGFAYVVPYKDTPTFIIGYKGLIQLAMRTGAYRTINADVVYEGELQTTDKLTGTIDLAGKRTSDTVVGYFAHFETVNGFRKTAFMLADDMRKYSKKYSKSFNSQSSPWKTEPDAMGIKTMLRKLLGKYGIMSVEFATAMAADGDTLSPSGQLESDVSQFANQAFIDVDTDTGEVMEPEAVGSSSEPVNSTGPGF